MAEAKVCGNSEQARGLKDLLNQTLYRIETCVEDMDRAVGTIRSGWNDDGAGEVDEILVAIRNALKNATDAMPAVGNALDAYADFLDAR